MARAEDVRIVALDPGRDIDEEREARRVALGEAVLAEALDLAEAALGELALVAVADHAGDELLAEGVDGADVAEGGHGAAQPVGLVGREAGRRRWRSASPAPGTAARRGSCRAPPSAPRRDRSTGSLPVAPAQVGMHHVALDRPGAHDRHLDDEIVEAARLAAAAASTSAPGSRPGTRRPSRPGTACRRRPRSSRGTVASV